MHANAASVPVLTYHSISGEPGPTSIPRDCFRMQMDVLAECGYTSMTCEELLDWHQRPSCDSARRVMITFDDAFADFASEAFPVLREHGSSCVVFVPTAFVGAREAWRGGSASARPLLSWPAIRALAQSHVEFGGHGVTHVDLTALSPRARRHEIEHCAVVLAEHLGRRTRAFAAPYGRVNAAVTEDIARIYDVAFGTRLARAHRACPRHDLPRVEMHYFRDARQWRSFLRGHDGYLAARRTLRAMKEIGARVVDLAGRKSTAHA